MIKIVYKVLVKPGLEIEFKNLSSEVLIPQAHLTDGCILFNLFQNLNNEREFIFHELWCNDENVRKYYENLALVLGEPNPGKIFPEKFNELIAEEEDILYQEFTE